MLHFMELQSIDMTGQLTNSNIILNGFLSERENHEIHFGDGQGYVSMG